MLSWGYVESLINWFGIAAAAMFLGAYFYAQNGYTWGDPCVNTPDANKAACYQAYVAGIQQ